MLRKLLLLVLSTIVLKTAMAGTMPLYTVIETERDRHILVSAPDATLIKGWKIPTVLVLDRKPMLAYDQNEPGVAPVCRQFNLTALAHYFTLNCGDLVPGDNRWQSDGIVWYAKPPLSADTCPLGSVGMTAWVGNARRYEGTNYRFAIAGSVEETALDASGWNRVELAFCLPPQTDIPPPEPPMTRLEGFTTLDIQDHSITVHLGFAGELIMSFIPENGAIKLEQVARVCIESPTLGKSNRCVAPDTIGVAHIDNTLSNDCVQVYLVDTSGKEWWSNLDDLLSNKGVKFVSGDRQCLNY